MECLKLITANSLIEKRIGYLGRDLFYARAYSTFPLKIRAFDDGHQSTSSRLKLHEQQHRIAHLMRSQLNLHN